jgi:hypothetical protein
MDVAAGVGMLLYMYMYVILDVVCIKIAGETMYMACNDRWSVTFWRSDYFDLVQTPTKCIAERLPINSHIKFMFHYTLALWK